MILHWIRPDQFWTNWTSTFDSWSHVCFDFVHLSLSTKFQLNSWILWRKKPTISVIYNCISFFFWRKVMWINMVFLTVSRLCRQKVRRSIWMIFVYFLKEQKWIESFIYLFVYRFLIRSISWDSSIPCDSMWRVVMEVNQIRVAAFCEFYFWFYSIQSVFQR